jgi:hypothetical protein
MKKFPSCWTIHIVHKHGFYLAQCLNNGCLIGQGGGDTKAEAVKNLKFFMQHKL